MRLVVVAVAVSLGWAGTAVASTYAVHVDGIIDTQLTPGADPRFSLGTPVTLDATFSGAQVVNLAGVPASFATSFDRSNPSASFVVTFGGVTENGGDEGVNFAAIEIDDQITGAYLIYSGEMIAFANGRVLGAQTTLSPIRVPIPAIFMGSIFGYAETIKAGPDGTPVATTTGSGTYGDRFWIGTVGYDTYAGPAYMGTWDFAHSTVAVDGVVEAAPEPETWALLVAGFGFAGAELRRRRYAAA